MGGWVVGPEGGCASRSYTRYRPLTIHPGGLHGDPKKERAATERFCAALMKGMTCSRSYVRFESKYCERQGRESDDDNDDERNKRSFALLRNASLSY